MKTLEMPEWKYELDNLRGSPKMRKLTEEQLQQIHYARSGKDPVSFSQIKKWFDNKYGIVSVEIIKREYLIYVEKLENQENKSNGN